MGKKRASGKPAPSSPAKSSIKSPCRQLYAQLRYRVARVVKFQRERSFYWKWLGIAVFVMAMTLAGSIGPPVDFSSASFGRTFNAPSLFPDTTNWPGRVHKQQGAKPHHPVVFIPGVVSSALELWEGKPCAQKYFRQRFWIDSALLLQFLLDGECYLEHMTLDPETGLDPPGIKIRALDGLHSADYLIPGYWVWGRMIENLALVGYDPNNMLMMGYDWRLSYQQVEQRDRSLTKLMRVRWISSCAANLADGGVLCDCRRLKRWWRPMTGGLLS